VNTLIGLGRIDEAHGDLPAARSRFRQAVESAAVMGASLEGTRAVEALRSVSDQGEGKVEALRSAGLPDSVIEVVSAW
jgi:hypothetical protein